MTEQEHVVDATEVRVLGGAIQLWSPVVPSRLKMLVYGHSGVGKTPFAATFPRPLFLDSDKGMLSCPEGTPRWPIEEWQDLRAAIRYLKTENHGYETLIVDSMTEVQRQSMAYVVRNFPVHSREYGDMPTQPDWGKSLSDLEKFVITLKELPMRVVMTCHGSSNRYQNDRIEPLFKGKGTSAMVCRACDIIAYMYVSIEKSEPGKRPRRVMAFDYAPGVTRDRSGKLPLSIVDPTWEKLNEYLSKPKQVEKENPSERAAS